MGFSNIFSYIKLRAVDAYNYCADGVWNDPSHSFGVKLIKTANLAVNSFLDKNIQKQASALTYSTILAIVPALAMLFAIAKGFGFQNIMQSEIFRYFPSQSTAIQKVLSFVDSYLTHASEGLFVGIGLIFLLWTLISLMMSVEDSFNRIWSIRQGRSFYRKVTDYTAIFLVLPILIVCEGGITIFMATIGEKSEVFSPLITKLLDFGPILLTWLIFAGAFALVPYTRVRFKFALISGFISGTAFQILQWLFVSGQMYVSKYNAIYGSFAFIPLFLIWLQLTWVITLTGAMLTYTAQSVFSFNFQSNINKISNKYYTHVTVVIMSLIVKRFCTGDRPYSAAEIASSHELPHSLVIKSLNSLTEIGYLNTVEEEEDNDSRYQPAFDINKMTVTAIIEALNSHGDSFFLKSFDTEFNELFNKIESIYDSHPESDILIKDL
ncbi:MAG: YihY/virulence factor BrkB family protein [Muribaculaceae bacterium]|nr:YihY/virulence factor BrkB family protein [Muribaculaceae bacterium]